MPTFVFSKKDFIKWVNKVVGDDKVVVMTNELSGTLSTSKKSGLKITHQYAPDCFEADGIGHLYFGKSNPLGIIISDVSLLSEKSKQFLKTQNSKSNEKANNIQKEATQ